MMQEILSEYQGKAAGVATGNTEQAADSARHRANHRIPLGGLKPCYPLGKNNTDSLSVLPAMNDTVEGAALRLAEAQTRTTWLGRRTPGRDRKRLYCLSPVVSRPDWRFEATRSRGRKMT